MTVPVQEKVKPKQMLSILISYNGMNERFQYTARQAAKTIRVRALNHYGISGADRDLNFMFGPDNQTEIVDGESMGSQVEPGSQLYLRPRTAGGGQPT